MRRRDSGNFAFSFSRQFARHQINTASDQRSRFNKKQECRMPTSKTKTAKPTAKVIPLKSAAPVSMPTAPMPSATVTMMPARPAPMAAKRAVKKAAAKKARKVVAKAVAKRTAKKPTPKKMAAASVKKPPRQVAKNKK
jgi:hypothetical protein